ncbi:MAG: hypothetical protein GX295_11675 [Syntrophomonadaceae bacterium]|nr:hypothetical protein [Syntrophomonadaceae bacterium]
MKKVIILACLIVVLFSSVAFAEGALQTWVYGITAAESGIIANKSDTVIVDTVNTEIRLDNFGVGNEKLPDIISFFPEGNIEYAVLTKTEVKHFLFDGTKLQDSLVLNVPALTNPLALATTRQSPNVIVSDPEKLTHYNFTGQNMINNSSLAAAGLTGCTAISVLDGEYAAVKNNELKRYTLGPSGFEIPHIWPGSHATNPIDVVLLDQGTGLGVLDGDKVIVYELRPGNSYHQAYAASGLLDPKALAQNTGKEFSVVDGKQVKTYLFDGANWVYSTALSVTNGLTAPTAVAIRPGTPDRLIVDGNEVKYYMWDGNGLVYNPTLSKTVDDIVSANAVGLTGEVTSAVQTTTQNMNQVRVMSELELPNNATVTFSMSSDGGNTWIPIWQAKGTANGSIVKKHNGVDFSINLGDKNAVKPFGDNSDLWVPVAPGKQIAWKALLEADPTDGNKTPKIDNPVRWQAMAGQRTPTSLKIIPSEATIKIGATQQLEAQATFDDNTSIYVTTQSDWASDNSWLASVNNSTNKGLVTANNKGDTLIHASYGGKSTSAKIMVLGPEELPGGACITKLDPKIKWEFKDPHVPNNPPNKYDETKEKIPNPKYPPDCSGPAGCGDSPPWGCVWGTPCTPMVPAVPCTQLPDECDGEYNCIPGDCVGGSPEIPEIPGTWAIDPEFPKEMDNPCYYSKEISENRVQEKYRVQVFTKAGVPIPGYDSGDKSSGIKSGDSQEYAFSVPANVEKGTESSEFFKSGDYEFKVKVTRWVASREGAVEATEFTPEDSCTFPAIEKEVESEDITIEEVIKGNEFCVVYTERPRIIKIISPPAGQIAPSEASPIIIAKRTVVGSLPKIRAGSRAIVAVDTIGPVSAMEIMFPYLSQFAVVENLKSIKPAGSKTNTWTSDFYTNSDIKICPTGTVVKMTSKSDAGAAGSYTLDLPPYADGIARTEGTIDQYWTVVPKGYNR